MGTRLTINKSQEDYFYATKLYGYTDDLQELKSFQFLVDEGYVPEDCNDVDEIPPVLMYVMDFKKWIKLYNEDLIYSPTNSKDDLLKVPFIMEILKMDNLKQVLLTWG